MSRFKLLYFVIFIINLPRLNAQISDKRLCVDEECKVPISHAKTLLRYSSPDSRILSFAPNVDITIYSKSAGSREDLWGGEINGKRGYIPKHLVRETKILQKPNLLVDTEFNNETANQVPSQVEPDKVQEPFEVVDGTTIYMSPQEGINPTSTDSSVQSTAVPSEGATPPPQTKDTPVSNNDQSQEVGDSEEGDDEEDDDDDDPEEDENDVEVEIEVAQAKDDDKLTGTLQAEDAPPGDQTPPTPPEVVDAQKGAETSSPQSEGDGPQVVETPVVAETTQETSPDDVSKAAETLPVVEEAPDVSKVEEQPTEQPPQPVEIKETVTSELPSDGPTPEPVLPEESKEALISEEDASAEVVPPVEATTLSPEFEVPEPPVDNIEVTPNPLEEVKEEVSEEAATVLPPLGLFGGSLLGQTEEKTESEDVAIKSNEETLETSTEQEEIPQSTEETLDVSTEQPPEAPQRTEETAESTEHQQEEIETPQSAEDDVHNQNLSDSSEIDTPEEVAETTQSTESSKGEDSPQHTDTAEEEEESGPGFFAGLLSFFSTSEDASEELIVPPIAEVPSSTAETFCDATSKMDFFSFNTDVFLYLVTTAISVIIFLFGYVLLDKSKQQGPLIAKINKLEKDLLVIVKENQILQEKASGASDGVSSEFVEDLKMELVEMSNVKTALEEQVQSLEKELENSTEVGMELNRMLSEILSSESGSEVLQANVENLQRQLIEQQSTINSVNETLAITNTENHELRLELDLSNKKVLDLQTELDKLLLNILKIEEEKDAQQSTLETEINTVRLKYDEVADKLKSQEEEHSTEIKQLKGRLEQAERKLELKTKEYDGLTETLKQLKVAKNKDEIVKSLLDVGGIKAELQVLKSENQRFVERLQQEEDLKASYEKKARMIENELQQLKDKYEEADKSRAESQTKLEVLSNYFKDREAQWQKEISKHEALWAEKEGEASSTTERIKFMQEQLQNYKAQTESLKQEIMSQEIELKSQISVLEKKAHENWVSTRQAERKAEDAKQEAAQLRHRLTLRERALQEDKNQHRLQSPIDQNGDLPVSPMESPASPPLLYGARDHITKSPPLPGLPPFLPPPPGVPFMPPPLHGVPPFIPPPPNMFPGEHRPPPLGRMSSPPLNRYSPSSRGYSPYDRNSSSPSDSEYGTSPPHRRGYSPFNNRGEERRDYKRAPPGRSNGRSLIKGGSSGSGHSNESLEKISRTQSKV